jgi:hypothetical protein
VREICTLGAMWRGWKRVHGPAIEALPTETRSNKLGQTFGTPRQPSTRPSLSDFIRSRESRRIQRTKTAIRETRICGVISFAFLARHASKVALRGITAATYGSSLAPRAAVRPGVVVFILIAITLALLIVLWYRRERF